MADCASTVKGSGAAATDRAVPQRNNPKTWPYQPTTAYPPEIRPMLRLPLSDHGDLGVRHRITPEVRAPPVHLAGATEVAA